MTRTWSVQEAKANFSELLREAEKEPQTITRHGKVVATVNGGEIPPPQPRKTLWELLRGNHTFTPPSGEDWNDDWLDRAELTLRPAPFEDEG